jgi:hypothetical protein
MGMNTPVAPANETQLRKEQKTIYIGSGLALLLCIVMLGTAILVLPRMIEFPGDDLESKLTFLAGANVVLVFWVIFGIRMVASGRRRSADDIVGSAYADPSPKIAVASAFLQNTLEQFVVASVTLSALVLLGGASTMPFVAASVVLFDIGRVSFLRGYPKGAGGRAFGMAVTALPSAAAFLISIGLIALRL